MSKPTPIQRYDVEPGQWWESPHGAWVSHSDHLAAMAAKDAEIARIRVRFDALCMALEGPELRRYAEGGYGEIAEILDHWRNNTLPQPPKETK